MVDATIRRDAAAADGTTADATPRALHVLVPSALGATVDFAYTQADLYPIVNLGGQLKLLRCPGQTCGSAPQVIGAADNNGLGGVEILGNTIFWLASPTRIMQAALDGTAAAVRYEFPSGVIKPPLRGSGSKLYFNYVATASTHASGGLMAMDATGSGPPLPLSSISQQQVTFAALDARGAEVATWMDSGGSGPTPLELYHTTTGTITTITTSLHIPHHGLVLATDGVAWLERGAHTDVVHACAYGGTCNSAVISPVLSFNTIAASGNTLYFQGRDASQHATIVSCELSALVHDACTPQIVVEPMTPADVLTPHAIRADASAVYVATDADGSGSMWKINL